MIVPALTALRAELVRCQHTLIRDLGQAVERLVVDAQALQLSPRSDTPLGVIERQTRRIRLLQERLLEVQVILGWLPVEEVRASL
jgi:hypothetical protein